MAFFQPFKLERYFAEHEFKAKYLLCSSDCESISIRELLDLESGATEALLDSRLGYTETRGAPALRTDIARLYAGGVGPDDVIVHAGAEEAILDFCLATLSAGDHVVVNFPCYQSLSEIPRSLGCAVSPWAFRESDGRWFLDPDELARLLRAKTKLVVLNTPHNPTGALMRREELDRVVALCRKAGAMLFVDEVYRHLELDPARRLPAICEIYERGISLNVLSKSAGLAGLRIGWLASKMADALDEVATVKDYNSICSSGASEILAGVAVRHLDGLVSRNLSIVSRNLGLLGSFFARRGDLFSWNEPEGGSIAFPRLASGADAEELALRAVRECGVLLLPGKYYDYDPAHFRIGFGRANLPEALAVLEGWLESRE